MTRIALGCFEEQPDGSWICRNDITIRGRACEVSVTRNRLFRPHTIFAGFGDFSVESRIKVVKKIAERPGYEVYKDDLDRACHELAQYDELRHFMTHGFLSLTVDRKGNHEFEFLRYVRGGEGKFNLMRGIATIEHLRAAANDTGKYVSDVIRLFERIYREKKLESKPIEE
jgi:hypothetical protein